MATLSVGASTASAVYLRYFTPPEGLRAHFGSAYVFAHDLPTYADLTRADMAQLRFMLKGGGVYQFQDGHSAPTPEICLLGPTTGATRFQLDAPTRVFGISILPLGWLALHGGDASLLADRLQDMAAGGGGFWSDLLDDLRRIDDVEEASAHIWTRLSERIEPVPDSMVRFVAATDAWLSDEGSPQLGALVEATNLSARQVARLTNRLYGASPKLLARKYRALRCAARLVIDHQPWQELCEDGTFYDQSHLIREIKHFLGLTPHQLMTDPTEVARLTLQRRNFVGQVAEINRIS